jgi:hypothetical protein
MGAEDWRNRTFGTAAAGFRIWRETAPSSTLRIACWGYWPADVAASFSQEALAALTGLEPPIGFLLDASLLRPQGEAGQQALQSLMRALAKLRISSATVLANDILTRMQLVRLANNCGSDVKKILRLADPIGSTSP